MINLQKIPIKIESDKGIFLVKEKHQEFGYKAVFEISCFHKKNKMLNLETLPFAHKLSEQIGFSFINRLGDAPKSYPSNLRTVEARVKQSKINQKFLTKLVRRHFPGYESFRFKFDD